MLNVTYKKPFMLSGIMLNVIMLSVMAPKMRRDINGYELLWTTKVAEWINKFENTFLLKVVLSVSLWEHQIMKQVGGACQTFSNFLKLIKSLRIIKPKPTQLNYLSSAPL